jgi:triosephosphate isomerase
MARLVIAANWKMNIAPSEGVDFATRIRPGLEAIEGVEKIVCPPSLSLPTVAEELKQSEIGVGAQNMHYEASGAYTGEVSPAMVKELCEYVILGHSERRQHFGETDEMVARKVAAAIATGLKPILCVGETLSERESGDAHVVVQRQLRTALREVPSLATIIIAYEPVWAIGTGLPASPSDAQEIMEFIRGLTLEDFGASARDLPILYGGSVNADNVAGFVSQPDINGGLVGSASLDAEGFVALTRNAAAAYG